MQVNPNEAPEGYIAVEWDESSGCDYCIFSDVYEECMRALCYPTFRRDKHNVIFIKKE